MSQNSPLWKRMALALASTLLALVLAEVVLRAVDAGVITPELNFGTNTRSGLESGDFIADPDLFWTFPAKTTGRDASLGAVHPQRPLGPKRNKQRVIILGDSCSRLALGGLPYPATLQDLLGRRASVLTAAVPGYTSHQGLAWLRLQLLAAEPDLVVIYFGWNDHWRSTGLTDCDYAQSLAGSRLRLLSLFKKRSKTPPVRVPLEHYAENLTTMVEAVEEAGGEVLLVRAPQRLTASAAGKLQSTGAMVAGDDAIKLHLDYLAVLDQVVEETGAPVLDAASVFTELTTASLMHGDGIHLTTSGHKVMAALVADRVKTMLLGAPPSTRTPAALAREALRPLTNR